MVISPYFDRLWTQGNKPDGKKEGGRWWRVVRWGGSNAMVGGDEAHTINQSHVSHKADGTLTEAR